MSWQDREYYRDGSFRGFLSNPLMALMSWSLGLGQYGGVEVRFHALLLLVFLFNLLGMHWSAGGLATLLVSMAGIVTALLIHEAGHLLAARSVGGEHSLWVLWPLGGMVPSSVPPTARAQGIAAGGGILASFLTALGSWSLYLALLQKTWSLPAWMFRFNEMLAFDPHQSHAMGLSFLLALATTGWTLTFYNLLPFAIFDGGTFWQSILSGFTSRARAVGITAVAGMIVAGFMMGLSLMRTDLFGLIFWLFLFSSAYNGRQGAAEFADSYYQPTRPRRKRMTRRWLKWITRQESREQAEQVKIDQILAKVKERGLHSLTWFEKRTLRKATERQRQRDLAQRHP